MITGKHITRLSLAASLWRDKADGPSADEEHGAAIGMYEAAGELVAAWVAGGPWIEEA